MTSPLVLASTSPFRAALLTSAQVPFVAQAPKISEEKFKDQGLSPLDLVRTLARLKAESLRPEHPEARILGSDQAAVLRGEVLSKPGTPENNIQQLLKLQGKSHQLMTAAYLLAPPGQRSTELVEVATLQMRPLTLQEISDYVQKDQPWDCAGGYMFEKSGHQLFEKVDTQDPASIQGLPLQQIVEWWKSR